MSAPLVEICDASFSYGRQRVLHNINFTVNTGDFVAVIGPNGGGKTTLAKLILGLLQPQSGCVKVCGKSARNSEGTIGYVPQYIDHNCLFPATALDIVLMGMFTPKRRLARLRRTSVEHQRERAMTSLAALDIANLAKRKISELSGGQRQRVLIARALVAEPELLILDEPTASLDTRAQTSFLELLQELNKECTILVVSHDLLGIASFAKSVACVNRTLHHHSGIASYKDLLNALYTGTEEREAACPVEHLHQQIPVLQKEISSNV